MKQEAIPIPVGYLGIDPGISGGAAIVTKWNHSLSHLPEKVALTFKFKDATDKEISDFFVDCASNYDVHSALIEKVGATPQMGVTSAFTFGRSYGFLVGMLAAHGFSYDFVSPAIWQKSLKCMSGGKKKITRAKAQTLYGNQLKITDAIADAILIATFLSRKSRGVL